MKNTYLYIKSSVKKLQEQSQRIVKSNKEQLWSIAVYWFVRILINVSSFLCYIIVSTTHWGKKRTIPPIKNDLLLLSATKLAENIRNGKLTSETVVSAYIRRIIEVNSYINAVAEDRFEEAIKEAKECDCLIASGIYTKLWLEKEKPLFGVPVTIKVLIKVKGCHSTGAMMLFKDLIATEDAPAVELLKSAGSIILVTTNSAESGLGFDTITKLYGKTLNPYNLHRSSGGSSGGESALLSSAGSVIGIGNDMLGSLRIPAHYTGLFAHKPSRGIVPNTGIFPPAPAKLLPYLVSGPICRYAEDLETMMAILTSKSDGKMAFNQPVNFKKLKIYYQTRLHNPLVETVDEEIINSMMMAIQHFTQNYGATAEEVDMKMDKGGNMAHHLLVNSVEPVVFNSTAGKIKYVNIPLELLKLLFGKSIYSLWSLVTYGVSKNPLLYSRKDIPFYFKLQSQLYKEFESRLDENSIFICPTMPFTAPLPYLMMPRIYSSAWVGVFSYLGIPVTQIPLGLSGSGMPQGMQMVTAMNNDRLGLACAKELSKVFGGWIAPS